MIILFTMKFYKATSALITGENIDVVSVSQISNKKSAFKKAAQHIKIIVSHVSQPGIPLTVNRVADSHSIATSMGTRINLAESLVCFVRVLEILPCRTVFIQSMGLRARAFSLFPRLAISWHLGCTLYTRPCKKEHGFSPTEKGMGCFYECNSETAFYHTSEQQNLAYKTDCWPILLRVASPDPSYRILEREEAGQACPQNRPCLM